MKKKILPKPHERAAYAVARLLMTKEFGQPFSDWNIAALASHFEDPIKNAIDAKLHGDTPKKARAKR